MIDGVTVVDAQTLPRSIRALACDALRLLARCLPGNQPSVVVLGEMPYLAWRRQAIVPTG